MIEPTYPDVHVQLTGEDGNVFVIIGAVSKALRREVSPEVANQWSHAAMNCDSYDAVIRLAMATVDVS